MTSFSGSDKNKFTRYFPKKNIRIPPIKLAARLITMLFLMPSLIRPYAPAPKFCPVYVAIVTPNVDKGVVARGSTFEAAVNAATTVDPKRLIALCNIIMPIAVIEN